MRARIVKEYEESDLTGEEIAIERFIDFYNNRRPHMSIGYQTPSQVHLQSGPQKKKWKGYQSPTSTFLGQ